MEVMAGRICFQSIRWDDPLFLICRPSFVSLFGQCFHQISQALKLESQTKRAGDAAWKQRGEQVKDKESKAAKNKAKREKDR